ncbi:MAG: PIN domain-containing protein [Simplicispira sp.]|uniref:PIN domain-containing protein n=1 Tax=Simplicispira sp. TaxID=2015802 RepID=UPI002590F420|nr:PIN domain-containing protein [Simplicispira sp.]MDD2691462.1 PIN domain-containing protein [Simplicispira sp.]
MPDILSVFPDTNLFLQCKPLRELDWMLLGHEGDIELLITRPVQTELDSLKAKGNSRQASRSRSAAALISELLDAPEEGLVLKQRPTVRLRMARAMRPDPDAGNELNYDSQDDQLVGIALAFYKANAGSSTLLLTYDHGPMFSAREMSLPFKKIPDEWLLPPEPDDASRREGALKSELERYQKSEPKFEVGLLDASTRGLELSFTIYSALSEEQIAALLAIVFSRYPEATDFGPSEPWESVVEQRGPMASLFGKETEVFTPSSAEEIERYKRRYSEWKEDCRGYLRAIHMALNKRLEWPTITTRISNVGSRPAIDALIELEAKGPIRIVRPCQREDDEDSDELKSREAPKFPQPPLAPSGHRRRIKPASPFAFGGMSDPVTWLSPTRGHFDTVPPLRNFSTSRDPNLFYWKDGTQGAPLSYLSLECEQWRHAREPEDFTAGIRFPRETGVHSGSFMVTVHASNLTNPIRKTFPVCIAVAETPPSAEVERQIEELSAARPRLRLS